MGAVYATLAWLRKPLCVYLSCLVSGLIASWYFSISRCRQVCANVSSGETVVQGRDTIECVSVCVCARALVLVLLCGALTREESMTGDLCCISHDSAIFSTQSRRA